MRVFHTGAPRPVTKDLCAERIARAQDLVRSTLARHGLSGSTDLAAPNLPGWQMKLPVPLRGARIDDLRWGGSGTLCIPDGAAFLSSTHQGRDGSRGFRTYVPASADQGITGIVMMLHGCTQTAEDFAVGTGMNTLSEAHRFVVIYPEQSRRANAQACWNWFSPDDQRRGRGEPEILSGIALSAMERYGVSPERTCVAGLSSGAAMAVILGQTYPDVFSAVGAHSGLPYGAASDVPTAFAAMAGQAQNTASRLSSGTARVIVFHGAADSTVHPSNGESIARQAERDGPPQSILTTHRGTTSGRGHTTRVSTCPEGRRHLEHWVIDGLSHAWSGGHPGGSYTDPRGPDASAEMVRFFRHADGHPK